MNKDINEKSTVITPVFEAEKKIDPKTGEYIDPKTEKGKNKIAQILRPVSVVIALIYLVAAVVISVMCSEYLEIVASVINAILIVLLLNALADILDYLAELTAIAKAGYEIKNK